MKKFFICTILAITVIFCLGAKGQSLKQLSKPHLGEYFCTSIIIFGEEKIEEFKEIKLVLKKDNKMVIRAKSKDGQKRAVILGYKYEDKVLTVDGGNIQSSLKDGVIVLTYTICGKSVVGKFERK